MILESDFERSHVEFNYNGKLLDIPLIGVHKITNKSWGKLHLLINQYYNGERKYLKLLLDFNQISDLTKLKIGTIIKLPDFQAISDIITFEDIDENNVNGVFEDSDRFNDSEFNNDKTTALPKLKITKRKVQYNPETGELIF